jgi:hypothetical protein
MKYRTTKLNIALAVLSLLLAACGGGGAATLPGENVGIPHQTNEPVDNFSLSHKTLGFTSWEGFAQAFTQEVTGSLRELESEVYIFVDSSSTPLISQAEVSFSQESLSGIINFTSEWSDVLLDGTHAGTIQVSACKDPSCEQHYRGSPRTIDVIYTILPAFNPDISCEHVPGVVFDECVDPTWIGSSAWELVDDGTNTHFHYIDGDFGKLISWNVVDTDEPGYENVLNVEYSDSRQANGSFRFFAADGGPDVGHTVDMGAYLNGTLEFDYRVLDWGTNTSGLIFAIECIWPCTTGNIPLGQTSLNEWNHEVIFVEDLISVGLDVSKVTTGFLVSPVWEDMAGVRFQLDNVRWVAGEGEIEPSPTPPLLSGLTLFSSEGINLDFSIVEWDDFGTVNFAESADGADQVLHYTKSGSEEGNAFINHTGGSISLSEF